MLFIPTKDNYCHQKSIIPCYGFGLPFTRQSAIKLQDREPHKTRDAYMCHFCGFVANVGHARFCLFPNLFTLGICMSHTQI